MRLNLAITLDRRRRGACHACRRRRVLYSLNLASRGVVAESDRLCAECAGIVGGVRPGSLDDLPELDPAAYARAVPGEFVGPVVDEAADEAFRGSVTAMVDEALDRDATD